MPSRARSAFNSFSIVPYDGNICARSMSWVHCAPVVSVDTCTYTGLDAGMYPATDAAMDPADAVLPQPESTTPPPAAPTAAIAAMGMM